MSTSLLTQADTTALLNMSQVDINKSVSQMTSLMNAIASEKDNIDSMASMLEKQPWYKKMWFTISGKNKATVSDIQQSKDKIVGYTSAALAELYKNSRIEQAQIIAVGQAVNSVNCQLAATNYELLKTQEAFAEFKNDIIDTIGSLANAMNEKITSIDSYHMLIEEITVGTFDYDNVIASLFSVIAQIDKRTAEDNRKMDILRKSMTNKGYLSDKELTIVEYMTYIAKLPDDIVGMVYYEFSCLHGNEYSQMFCEIIENYSMLPKMEKKSKKLDSIISNILQNYNIDSSTEFSTNEIYDYFIESKKDYLLNINEIVLSGEEEDGLDEDLLEAQRELHETTQALEKAQEEVEASLSESESLMDEIKAMMQSLGFDDDEYQDNDSEKNETEEVDGGVDRIRMLVNLNVENVLKSSGHPIYKKDDLINKQDKVRRFMGKIGIRATGDIIAIIDTSLTGSGSDGLLFTTEGISFDYAFEKVFLRYDEISYMDLNKRETDVSFHGWFSGVKDNNCTTPSLGTPYYNARFIKDLIEEIMKCC